MKALFLLSLILASAASGAVPQKAALTRYIQLWNESLFTRKPEPEKQVESTPLDDYALGGVSPVEGGYFVILLNKKKPEERMVIQPGQPSEFRVVEVRRGDTGPLSTTALVSAGGKSKLLSFDEKLLTLKAAPAAKPGGPNPQAGGQQGQPQQPQASQPGAQQTGGRPPGQNTGGGQNGNRPPRPRVIPPAQR